MKNIITDTIRRASGAPPTGKRAGRETLDDNSQLRQRASKGIERGAVTDDYRADRRTVIELLNSSLATELVCALRYRRHYFMATGMDAGPAAEEFMEHSDEELEHADMLAARIVQLGGEPDFAPTRLAERSYADYVVGKNLRDMMREDLIAERIAIETYGHAIRYVGQDDPTTRRMLEEILANEEEHADDLATLLDDRTGGASH